MFLLAQVPGTGLEEDEGGRQDMLDADWLRSGAGCRGVMVAPAQLMVFSDYSQDVLPGNHPLGQHPHISGDNSGDSAEGWREEHLCFLFLQMSLELQQPLHGSTMILSGVLFLQIWNIRQISHSF